MLDEVFGVVHHKPTGSQQRFQFPITESDVMTAFGTQKLNECTVDLDFKNYQGLSIERVNDFVIGLQKQPIEVLKVLGQIADYCSSFSVLVDVLLSCSYDVLRGLHDENLGRYGVFYGDDYAIRLR